MIDIATQIERTLGEIFNDLRRKYLNGKTDNAPYNGIYNVIN